jgi:hypothetical protein
VNAPVITTTDCERQPISTIWFMNNRHRIFCPTTEAKVSPASTTIAPEVGDPRNDGRAEGGDESRHL